MSDNIHHILKTYWGYDSFRPLQEEAIKSVISGCDTLTLMPTGGGKSLCFQVPAMAMDGLCLVVSPLISLMHDQVENLRKRGIAANKIVSGMNRYEIEIVLNNCVHNNIKILYVSPERLKTKMFIEHLKQMKLSLIAVDEAHCISQWGYDFRPPYLDIADIRTLHPSVPVMALTATATPQVVDDIKSKLLFRKNSNVFKNSFYRSNLAYMVFCEDDKLGRMLRIMRKVRGSGIVYVRNRRRTKEIAQYLYSQGISATHYHAGLSDRDRYMHQQRWHEGKVDVIVATNAFGMGIDKSDVRYVIHLDLPDSPEAYFQEAGRAGRDGKQAYAIVLYNNLDIDELKRGYQNNYPTLAYIQNIYRGVCNYYRIPVGSGSDLTFDYNPLDICNTYRLDILPFAASMKFLEREGLISIPDKQDTDSKLMITVSKHELYSFQVAHAKYDAFIKMILRMYGGVFTDFVAISELFIAKTLHYKTSDVEMMLADLDKMKILSYKKKTDKPQIIFTSPRVDASDLYLTVSNYNVLKKEALSRLEAMIGYVQDNNLCRSNMLLRYFGEENNTPCQKCDVCITSRKKTKDTDTLQQQIVDVLKNNPMTIVQLVEHFDTIAEDTIANLVRSMLEYGLLDMNDTMQLSPIN